jgi:hypothetical protein
VGTSRCGRQDGNGLTEVQQSATRPSANMNGRWNSETDYSAQGIRQRIQAKRSGDGLREKSQKR